MAQFTTRYKEIANTPLKIKNKGIPKGEKAFMTWYNPKIYNYKNLKEKDQNTFNDMIFFMVNEVENKLAYYDSEARNERLTIKTQLEAEIKVEVVSEVLRELQAQLVEYLVNIIDNYEEDIEEIETDDYFIGCPLMTNDE